MKSGKKVLAALAAAMLSVALAPAAEASVTGAVTGDGGTPVALTPGTPLAIRNMDVKAFVHVDASDASSFQMNVTDQSGTSALLTSSSCWPTSAINDDDHYVNYRGNGTYTLTVALYSDRNCATPKSKVTYQWTVGASVAVGQPAGALLTRQPNSFSTNTQLLDFTGTPGASSYEIKYELNGQAQGDGSLGGVPKDAFVDSSTGKVSLFESTPGTYLMVARARSGDYYTPWSAPITIHLIAPFDLSGLTFPDSRGPSYQARGTLGSLTSGKVSMAYAKGKKGKHFHGLGSARINSKGAFTRRFTLRHTGWYRLRFKFGGSSTVTGGTIYVVVHITRRIVG